MIRPSTEQGRVLLAVKCRAYADGTRDALAAVVDGLRATGDPARLVIAAEVEQAAAEILADQRRTFAERAGVEL